VLDHIAFGPFLEQPARKDTIPFVVALILHGQLDEGTGFGRVFPWRRLFAGAQADDRATDPRGVAGLHLKLADQSVALVEQADHRDALFHRRRTFDAADFLPNTVRLGELRGGLARALAVAIAVARGQRGRRDQRQKRDTGELRPHEAQSAPGRQAS